VNTYTTDNQRNPYVTSDGSGYLIVWVSAGEDGSRNGVYGQLIDPQTGKTGSPFRVNTTTLYDQDAISAASNGSNYLVTWKTDLGGGNQDIYGQLISKTGSLIGTEFLINTYTDSYQYRPSVASDGENYFVAWYSSTPVQDGALGGVYGQLLSSTGAKIGSEIQLNTYTSLEQFVPFVSSNGDNYLVAWTSQGQDGNAEGIFGRLIGRNGSIINDEFQINTYTTSVQYKPSVASDGTNYLVTWHSYAQDGSEYGVFGQLIRPDGEKTGVELQINSWTTGSQYHTFTVSDGSGYIVTWYSNLQDGSAEGVFGQYLNADGFKVGNEFQINTFTTGGQLNPSVSSNGSGFLIVWQSNLQDGDQYGIYARMTAVPEPTTFLLLGSGIIALMRLIRRNKE